MRGRPHVWLSAIFTIALSLLVLCPAHAQNESPADVASARELFREGLELSKQEKWEEARVKLAQSLGLKQAALTYYTLAVADKKSGHPVAALEHFRGFLAQPVTEKTEGFLEPARVAVAELEKLVAGVTIIVRPAGLPGLAVIIDGAALPVSVLGRRRLIDPGEHVVTVKAKGHVEQSKKIVGEKGGSHELIFTLQPAPEEEVPPPETEFPVVPVVLMGAGVAVAAVGLALGIVGANEAKDSEFSDGPVADSALRKTIIGDVLLGVGGATAAVGIVLLIVHFVADDEEPSDPAAIRPWGADGAVGVQLRF
jgi:hypothetical protein